MGSHPFDCGRMESLQGHNRKGDWGYRREVTIIEEDLCRTMLALFRRAVVWVRPCVREEPEGRRGPRGCLQTSCS